MKITQFCTVCNTEEESRHDYWESAEDMLAANLIEPEFPHDEGNRQCGGDLIYYPMEQDLREPVRASS